MLLRYKNQEGDIYVINTREYGSRSAGSVGSGGDEGWRAEEKRLLSEGYVLDRCSSIDLEETQDKIEEVTGIEFPGYCSAAVAATILGSVNGIPGGSMMACREEIYTIGIGFERGGGEAGARYLEAERRGANKAVDDLVMIARKWAAGELTDEEMRMAYAMCVTSQVKVPEW